MIKIVRFCMSAALVLVVLESVHAQDRPDHRFASIGISLGSDAYLAKMTNNGAVRTDYSVLVAPGTPLLVFKPGRERRRGRKLALSKLGVWLYIPTDRSNLVSESDLLHALRDRLRTGKDWRAFGKRVRVRGQPCVTFTPGELTPVTHDEGSDTYTVHLSASDTIQAGKLRKVGEDCSIATTSRMTFDLIQKDNFGHVNITDFILESFKKYLDYPNLDRTLFRYNIKHSLSKVVRGLYGDWPKLISLGTIMSYGCNVNSVESIHTREQQLEHKFSAIIEAAFGFLKIGTEYERTKIDHTSLQLKKGYRRGISVTDVASVYIRGVRGTYITSGKVGSCRRASENVDYIVASRPFWHRMHWDGSNPFVVDFPQYQSALDLGLKWDKAKGFIEIECFSRDYAKLRSFLRETMTARQAEMFMLHYVRPARRQWRGVYDCKNPD